VTFKRSDESARLQIKNAEALARAKLKRDETIVR
jgi:hypothetical protein